MFNGFEEIDIEFPDATIHARIGGTGEPLLLLHGYPQTHMMWHPIAEQLAQSYRVVVADLRGYGESIARNDEFTFRAMASDQHALMQFLGHEKFHVIAHDRGARTAHRMALDHTNAIRSLTLIDILPTLDVWATMDDWLAKRYYHWVFLSQPTGLPQRLISKAPVDFLRTSLGGLSGALDKFHPKALTAYERAAQNPNVVAAWCADYAAGATTDLEHDREDIGRTLDTPCLIMWGDKGVVAHHLDPVEAWQKWFPMATGQAMDTGHFIVEERPKETLQAVMEHLSRM